MHKDSVFCAVFDGKRYSEVEVFETFSTGIKALGQYLKTEGVNRDLDLFV